MDYVQNLICDFRINYQISFRLEIRIPIYNPPPEKSYNHYDSLLFLSLFFCY